MTATSFLKIGELTKKTGVSVGTLRYYETLRLLHPVARGENGYRYYSFAAIQQVQFIKKSQALGFSLEEIRQILDVCDRGERPCGLVQDLLDHKIGQLAVQIGQMIAFKLELEKYRDRWAEVTYSDYSDYSDQEICPLIATVPLQKALQRT